MTSLSAFHDERYDKQKISFVSLLSFLVGFIDAFILYILSSYFSNIIGSQLVGAVYLVTFGIHLILLLALDTVIRRIGRIRYLVLCIGASAVAVGVLSNVSEGVFGLFFGIVYLAFSNTIWVALDIILEGYSQDQLSGRIRGTHLMVMNIGFLLAPYLSTHLLSRFGYPTLFLFVCIGYVAIMLCAILCFRSETNERIERRTTSLFASLRAVTQIPDLRHIFMVSFALEYFYSVMIIYTALHLQTIGFSWNDIGVIFTVMLLPFVLLQYPAGLLADTRFGEKEMLAFSHIVTITAVLGMALYHEKHMWVWAGLLFATRVGVAVIEVLRDSYFYKQIDKNDTHIIAFFRMSRPIANILSACVSIGLLTFFPLTSVFYTVSLVLFLALFHVFALTDTESERECVVRAS